MEFIDFEAHFYAEEFISILAERTKLPLYDKEKDMVFHYGEGKVPLAPLRQQLTDLVGRRIEKMDEAGIRKSIVSASMGVERMEPKEGQMASRVLNDALARQISERRDRLEGWCTLAPDDVDGAVEEMERCKKELGFFGWSACSNYAGCYLDEARYFPVLEQAARLNMPVYIHPTVPEIPALHAYGPAMACSGLGFSIDVSIALTRLMFSGVFDKLPELTVMIGHLGEGFPFYLERLDTAAVRRQKVPNAAGNRRLPGDYFRSNILVTTSGNYSAPALRCARDVLGADRILFGSDYPMEEMKKGTNFLRSAPLPQEEKEGIAGGTACRLFPQLR